MSLKIDTSGPVLRAVEIVGEPREATLRSAGFLGTGAGEYSAVVVLVRRIDGGGEYHAQPRDLADSFGGMTAAEFAARESRPAPAPCPECENAGYHSRGCSRR